MRRRIGDFSILHNQQHGEDHSLIFQRFVPQIDLKRLVVVYVRKSNKMGSSDRSSYLAVQEALYDHLRDAGVPEDKIIVLQGDTGKSGALSRKFRDDLSRVHDLLNARSVGTIVAVDVARLFRDMWMKEPTDFAAKVAWGDARVLTSSTGDWKLLNMRDAADKNLFMRMAEDAANYRLTLRKQSMEAREERVSQGAYGGGPAPLGWAARAAVRKSESQTGVGEAAQISVYEPHARVKLDIMEASLLPSITSYRQLRRHIIEQGLVFPPFEPEIAREAFPRSCASRKFKQIRGERRSQRSDEVIVPTEKMLAGVLLEPLAIGDLFFGSGSTGKSMKAKMERYADAMQQPCDTWIRDYREYVGAFPKLALCRTPEQVALYWAVKKKWARVDPVAERESGYEVKVPNAHKSAGLLWTGTPHKREHLNPWAGKVFCLKHGTDEEGNPLRTHRMSLFHQGQHWRCLKDYMEDTSDNICAFWSCDNALGRILDAHLKRGIRSALQNKGGIVEDLVTARDTRKQQAYQLQAEIKVLEEEEAYQCALAEAYGRRLRGQADFTAAIDRYYEEHVTPVTMNLAEKRRDLRLAEAEGLTSPLDRTEREVSELLWGAINDWDALTLDERMILVAEFVQHVGVLIGDGAAREVYIEFGWQTGVCDRLIAWRGPSKDERDWTPEEDDALRALWPSDCAWGDIAARVQPERKFSSVYRRALALGVTKKAGRSRVWREEMQEQERCWGDRNPEVLYLEWKTVAASDEAPVRDYCLAVGKDGTHGQFIHLPPDVAARLQVIRGEDSTRTAARRRGPSGRPMWSAGR